MKTRIQGFLAAVMVASAILVTPLTARAQWPYGHGKHLGWYKHQAAVANSASPAYAYAASPGAWHPHHYHWNRQAYPAQAYSSGYAPSYNGYATGYPVMVPSSTASYLPGSSYGSAYPYSSAYSAYGTTYSPYTNKLLQREQKASARLSANQALYQAAMSQGNYALANKAQAHIQKQSNILNGANSMLGSTTPYSSYGAPAYGSTSYYGQPGYGTAAVSPLSSIFRMLP